MDAAHEGNTRCGRPIELDDTQLDPLEALQRRIDALHLNDSTLPASTIEIREDLHPTIRNVFRCMLDLTSLTSLESIVDLLNDDIESLEFEASDIESQLIYDADLDELDSDVLEALKESKIEMKNDLNIVWYFVSMRRVEVRRQNLEGSQVDLGEVEGIYEAIKRAIRDRDDEASRELREGLEEGEGDEEENDGNGDLEMEDA